ncbi:MAG: N-acetyltransferase [Sarcina sp.]
MIREFKEDDIDRVMEIWLNTSIVAHDFIDSNYWKDNYSIVRERYMPICKTYVYEENGIVKGFISLLKVNFIGAIFIDNDQRGKGIGSKLMNFVKDKYNNLLLEVYKDNNQSVNFYKKHGFEIISENLSEDTHKVELVMAYNKD